MRQARCDRDRYTVPKPATPMTWPSCATVVTRPLASAAWDAGTPTSDWVSSGGIARPRPAPATASASHNAGPPAEPPRTAAAMPR